MTRQLRTNEEWKAARVKARAELAAAQEERAAAMAALLESNDRGEDKSAPRTTERAQIECRYLRAGERVQHWTREITFLSGRYAR